MEQTFFVAGGDARQEAIIHQLKEAGRSVSAFGFQAADHLTPEIAAHLHQAVAKKLFGQTIAIHCYDNTVEHTVGTVNGQYWFKVDIGTQEGEPDTEEEPV